MLDEELSISLAHGKGMGLGELLFKQLTSEPDKTPNQMQARDNKDE